MPQQARSPSHVSACRDERQAAGRERPSQCADVPFTEWDDDDGEGAGCANGGHDRQLERAARGRLVRVFIISLSVEAVCVHVMSRVLRSGDFAHVSDQQLLIIMNSCL